jgi:hypothetical protein
VLLTADDGESTDDDDEARPEPARL